MIRKIQHHVREKAQYHKEKIKRHVWHVREKIKHKSRQARQKIDQVVTHKYFYPILFSVLAITTAITFIASASPSEEILQEHCEYQETTDQYTNCGEYETLRQALTNSFDKILSKIEADASTDKEHKKGLRTLQLHVAQIHHNWASTTTITDRHIFSFALLEFIVQKELLEFLTPLYPDAHLVIRTQNGSGANGPYPYQASHEIDEGASSLIMQIKFTNTTDATMQLKNLALKLGNDLDQPITASALSEMKLYDSSMNTRWDGIVNTSEGQVIWAPHVLLSPGTSTFQVWGNIENNWATDKQLQFFVDTDDSVIVSSDGLYIESELITSVKDLSYINVSN